MDKITAYENQLDQELSKIPQLRQLESASGVKKTYIIGGVVAFTSLLIFFNVAGQLLTNLIGFAYPAYASFKAIESASKEDDVQWLTYWTVFGFFSIVETVVDTIVYWFPFYYLVKVLFLLYLYIPQFKGAEVIYRSVLRPRLLASQTKIDPMVDGVKKKMSSVEETLKDE